MTRKLTISVIIPTYNSAAYLPETLESVLAQTCAAHEILVIDDGSTDNTDQVLAPYRDAIVYFKQPNSGAATARNLGLDRARGEWVAFLDSDDIWQPHKLEKHVKFLEQHRGEDYVCVHSWYYLFGDHEGVPERPVELLEDGHNVDLLIAVPVVHPSAALVKRETPVRFRTWAEPSEDMIYFAELSELGRFAVIDEPLAGYRKRCSSVTKKPGNVSRSFAVRQRWIEEVVSPAEPEKARRLLRRLYQSLAQEVVLAKWLRDWQRYWELRHYLERSWPWPEPPPRVTSERLFPLFVYRFKDAFDRLFAAKRPLPIRFLQDVQRADRSAGAP